MSSLPLHIEVILRKNGLILDGPKRDMLCRYVELLLEWNKKINLVSRRDTETIWSSHILHSLSPLFLLDIPIGVAALDLGTGGGLPGIPLAIVHAGLRVTLLDSIQKKGHALQSIVQELNLTSAQVVTGRAEDVAVLREHRGAYDLVLSRAVGPLKDLVAWSRPFLRKRELDPSRRLHQVDGKKNEFHFPYLLALKGGDLEGERRSVLGRTPDIAITEIAIVFPGLPIPELVDKKILIVEIS